MSVTIGITESDFSDERLSAEKQKIVNLKRPRQLSLSEDDLFEQGLLASDLASFQDWLYFHDFFDRQNQERELQASLKWQTFARLLHEMGYVRKASYIAPSVIDYKFTDADEMVGRFRRTDLDFVPVDPSLKTPQNLFALAHSYLSFLVEQNPDATSKNGLYRRFIKDLALICEAPPGPDRNPYFTARRLQEPPEVVVKKPKVLSLTDPIPAFLKEKKPDSLMNTVAAAPAASAAVTPPSDQASAVPDTPIAVKPVPLPDSPLRHFAKSFARVATSSSGIAARSIVTGALVTSASRIAIVAGLGFFGVGALPAGIAAGVAVGAWKIWSNYRKNQSGVQASFGVAATATGAVLGAFGADVLIEPVAQYLAEPLRTYVITPASEFLRQTGIGGLMVSARQFFVDPVANFFADRSGLQQQINELRSMLGEKDQQIDALEARLEMAGEEGADIEENDSGLTTRKVRAIMISPDGMLPAISGEPAILPALEGGELPVDPTITGGGSLELPVQDTLEEPVVASLPSFEMYNVARGDNLYSIAQDEYGLRGARLHEAVKKIIALNPEIASEPDKLTIGQPLRLPVDLNDVASAECDERRLRLGRSGACMVPSVG